MQWLTALLVTAFVVIAIQAAPADEKVTDTVIRGLVLPHSHDDVGWIVTIQGYYNLFVKRIYDSVVEALTANPKRKFISVEMAFFSMWWKEANDTQKEQFRALLANGQMEFILGGWSMADEACTTYDNNLNQMTHGHQFIRDTFGAAAVPKLGWQIDPFGASSVVHRQFAEMGFDATVIARIPYRDKEVYQQEKQLEFLWRGSASIPSTEIFTHCLDEYRYMSPMPEIDWSKLRPPVTPSNIKTISDKIVIDENDIKQRSAWFQSNAVIFPWGSDFLHFLANYDFQNMDQLVDYINANSSMYGVTLEYVTLSEYFNIIHSGNFSFGVKTSDFFPYDDGYRRYWTGYFSSRSALKGFTRTRENVGRAAEVLTAMASVAGKVNLTAVYPALNQMRDALGEAAHHDAVSGTSEPWVNKMYFEHMATGTDAVGPVITSAAQQLTGATGSLTLDETLLKNLSPSNPVQVAVYNSLGWTSRRFVRVPLWTNKVTVTDVNVNTPRNSTPDPCQQPGACGYHTASPYELFFSTEVDALGFNSYKVSQTAAVTPFVGSVETVVVDPSKYTAESFTLVNSAVKVVFDKSTGLVQSLTPIGQSSIPTTVAIMRYNPWSVYTNRNMTEGPYMFVPNGPALETMKVPLRYEVVSGPYVNEVRQYFTEPCPPGETQADEACGVVQVIRLYHDPTNMSPFEYAVEILHDIGPLPPIGNFVLRVATPLSTGGQFVTDENCFETRVRVYNTSQEDVVAGNFYPVTCSMSVRDQQKQVQLTLLGDRTHSGSSQSNGSLEVMIHRRTFTSDPAGPMALDDTDRLENIQTFLVAQSIEKSADLRHALQFAQQFPPTLMFGASAIVNSSSMLRDLPASVHLQTYSTVNPANSTILLRLAHVYEVSDSSPFAQPISIDLKDYFDAFAKRTATLSERTLNGVHPVAALNNRLQWTSSPPRPPAPPSPQPATPTTVLLYPTQVRTFYVTFN